jgi:hypothetical protein
MILRL